MDKESYYWTTAVIFTGRDLNKALIRYLEDRLVAEARMARRADLLRAGSKLTSNQYCMPVLGLIFLRYAYSRFMNMCIHDIKRLRKTRLILVNKIKIGGIN